MYSIFQGTIDNAIKRAKDTDANVETVIEIRGPGNTFIIAECFAKHKKISEAEINVCETNDKL